MSMTESEAIEKLEFLNEALSPQFPDSDECSCALQMGMDAIKEIQQCRAIGLGSPEEVEQDLLLYKADREVLREFETIGTVSEFRELKEINEKITEVVNKQLVAGRNSYKETHECFHKIADIVQGRNDYEEERGL